MSAETAMSQVRQASAALEQIEEATQACVEAADAGSWPEFEMRRTRVHALIDIFLDGYASARREMDRVSR